MCTAHSAVPMRIHKREFAFHTLYKIRNLLLKLESQPFSDQSIPDFFAGFFAFPSYIYGVHHFWVRFLRM